MFEDRDTNCVLMARVFCSQSYSCLTTYETATNIIQLITHLKQSSVIDNFSKRNFYKSLHFLKYIPSQLIK